MKNRIKILATLLSVILISGSISLPIHAASNNYGISRVGKKEKTVYVGNEFDLEVKKLGTKKVKDSKLKWTIKNTSIVGFDDDDRYDDEVELRAKKAGSTTVTCKNLATGKSITYKITVKKDTNTKKISLVGNKTKTVPLGEDIELKVKKGSGIKDSQIKWTISNTKLLKFDDGDRIGKEVELDAVKTGTTTVTAKNLVTGKKVTYTIKVVR